MAKNMIMSRPATPEYREGWDRAYGGENSVFNIHRKQDKNTCNSFPETTATLVVIDDEITAIMEKKYPNNEDIE